MQRGRGRRIGLLLLICLLGCCGFAFGAEQSGDTEELEQRQEQPPQMLGFVDNEYDLENWLYDHEGVGGTVYLLQSVTITNLIGPFSSAEAPLIVDTLQYGLLYDGGALIDDYGFLTIRGQGVEQPVVEIRDMGRLFIGNWNTHLLKLHIEAYGDDSRGGTAVRLSGADDSQADLSLIQSQGRILARGNGAVGLETTLPLSLYALCIKAEGENSRAVQAPEGTTFLYCRLTAQGAGAQLAAGGAVLLDSCLAGGEFGTAQVVQRRMLQPANSCLYLPLPRTDTELPPDDFLLSPFAILGMVLSGTESQAERTDYFGVQWDQEAWAALSLRESVLMTLAGQLDAPFRGLSLGEDALLQLTVEVRDPALPCISGIDFFADDGALYAQLTTWAEYDPVVDAVRLWQAMGPDAPWQDVTEATYVRWQGNSLRVYPQMDWGDECAFYIEQEGVGVSNVVVLFGSAEVPYGQMGGDRYGTDRSGASQLPKPSEPIPDPVDDEEVAQPGKRDDIALPPVAMLPPNNPHPRPPLLDSSKEETVVSTDEGEEDPDRDRTISAPIDAEDETPVLPDEANVPNDSLAPVIEASATVKPRENVASAIYGGAASQEVKAAEKASVPAAALNQPVAEQPLPVANTVPQWAVFDTAAPDASLVGEAAELFVEEAIEIAASSTPLASPAAVVPSEDVSSITPALPVDEEAIETVITPALSQQEAIAQGAQSPVLHAELVPLMMTEATELRQPSLQQVDLALRAAALLFAASASGFLLLRAYRRRS